MARLTSEVKTYITQALACFDSPSQVAQAVKREFGITVSRQQCESHDPTKVTSKGLGGNTCGSGRARERAGPGSPNPQSYR